jgi:RNA-directed DNA polymerase
MAVRKSYPLTASVFFKLWSIRRLAKILGISKDKLAYVERNPRFRCYTTKEGRECKEPIGPTKWTHETIAAHLKRIERPAYIGAQEGTSYVSNAAQHIGIHPSVRLDISKFYRNTREQQVFEFFRYRLLCSYAVASTLASVICYSGYLPIGSPVSSYMWYFANLPMYEALSELAREKQCVFTCFMDDIVFTGPGADGELLADAIQILGRSGFRHVREKSGVLSASRPKKITGVMVTNNSLSVPNDRQRKIGPLFKRLQRGETCVRNELCGRLGEAAQIEPRFRRMIWSLRTDDR